MIDDTFAFEGTVHDIQVPLPLSFSLFLTHSLLSFVALPLNLSCLFLCIIILFSFDSLLYALNSQPHTPHVFAHAQLIPTETSFSAWMEARPNETVCEAENTTMDCSNITGFCTPSVRVCDVCVYCFNGGRKYLRYSP